MLALPLSLSLFYWRVFMLALSLSLSFSGEYSCWLSVCFSGEHSCWHCLSLCVLVESIHVGTVSLSLCFSGEYSCWLSHSVLGWGGGGLFVDKLTHLYLIICIIQQYSVCHCVYHRGDPVLMTGR